MSREKIEEMAKNCHFYDDGVCHLCEELLVSCDRKCDLSILVENLYTAGYRKQSEVIDEFVELLKKEMNNLSRMEYHCDPYFLVSKDFVDRIAAKMKGGAE